MYTAQEWTFVVVSVQRGFYISDCVLLLLIDRKKVALEYTFFGDDAGRLEAVRYESPSHAAHESSALTPLLKHCTLVWFR